MNVLLSLFELLSHFSPLVIVLYLLLLSQFNKVVNECSESVTYFKPRNLAHSQQNIISYFSLALVLVVFNQVRQVNSSTVNRFLELFLNNLEILVKDLLLFSHSTESTHCDSHSLSIWYSTVSFLLQLP